MKYWASSIIISGMREGRKPQLMWKFCRIHFKTRLKHKGPSLLSKAFCKYQLKYLNTCCISVVWHTGRGDRKKIWNPLIGDCGPTCRFEFCSLSVCSYLIIISGNSWSSTRKQIERYSTLFSASSSHISWHNIDSGLMFLFISPWNDLY